MTIRRKLLLLAVIPALVAVGVVGAVLTSYQAGRQEARLVAKVHRYAEVSAMQLRSAIAFADRETARETLDGVAHDPDVVRIRLHGADGTVMYSHGTATLGGSTAVTVPVVSLEGPRGTLDIALSREAIATERAAILRITLAVAIGAILLALLLALPFARQMSRRIRRVATYAARVADGEFAADPGVARDGNDEVADTANAVHSMVSRLELMVSDRTKQLRFVLDHVNQGLVAVRYDGTIVGERSRMTDELLGALEPGDSLAQAIAAHDPRVGAMAELAFAQLAEGVLPAAVALYQMPQELIARGRILAIAYTPLIDDAGDPRLLVSITDVTSEREGATASEAEAETAALVQALAEDRHGARRFLDDARAQIAVVGSERDVPTLYAALHTLKGNAALMNLDAWVARCHAAETTLNETGALSPDQRQSLLWAWSATEGRVEPFLAARDAVQISAADYAMMTLTARHEASWSDMRTQLLDATLEPTALPLRRLAEHCRELALRYRRDLRMVIRDHGVRLDPEHWSAFWSVLTHVVRNVVAHGAHTAAPTTVTFSTTREVGGVTLEIADTGPGIQWERLRERAIAANLPASSRGDLIAAMFTTQISTRESVDETAGRGVGLAAVYKVCHELGIGISVVSSAERGTAFKFHLPTLIGAGMVGVGSEGEGAWAAISP